LEKLAGSVTGLHTSSSTRQMAVSTLSKFTLDPTTSLCSYGASVCRYKVVGACSKYRKLAGNTQACRNRSNTHL
jgi:hypothetical protein